MNEIAANQQSLVLILKIGLWMIGILITIVGGMIGIYLSSQLRTLKRLEDIDTETMHAAAELKDRIGVHIGDSTYRFEVIQERLARLEKTQGDHDLETGCLYLRRRYDSPKLLSNPPRKPKP